MIRPLWGVCLAMLTVLAAVASLPFPTAGIKTPGGGSINGDQEILADPVRPMIYWAHPDGSTLSFLDAFTGNELSSVVVGQGPMSVDLSSDGTRLYVAVSGENQTTVVDVVQRTVLRAIPLGFSPLSVRSGRPDRLFVSGAQDSVIRIVNETTGNVVDEANVFRALLEVSPDKTVLLAHSLSSSAVTLDTFDVSADRLVFRASNGSDVGENPLQTAVDWDAGLAYLVSGTPYGIVVLAVSNLTQVGWLPMGAYPQGVALMRNRHVVIGIHRNFYDAALWVFNTTTDAERTTVPIPVAPGSGYVSEQSLLVASDVAGTVLLWTEGDFRLLTVDPSVSPAGPAADGDIAGLPGFYVRARVWRGLVEPPSNTTTLAVDGTTLNSVYDPFYREVRAVAPLLPVGRHRVTAEIVWPGGSNSVTWNFTVTSPPAAATFVVVGSNPLRPGQTIVFDASNSTGLGTITFVWDFGDGAQASGPRVTHAFAAPGVYRVLLTIRTELNVSDSLARQVVIGATSGIPPQSLGAIVGIGSFAAGLALALLVIVFLRRRPRSGPGNGPGAGSRRP
ncbi:MAG: PKD domain-containing protein [Methanobacteriota archaeon]|nr:MAG: PKD domain-containing protein [Euryarchaeota archaeon]